MTGFDIHTQDSAPEASRPVLAAAQQANGFVPHLLGVLAESPAAVGAYPTLAQLFGQATAFDASEQQVVLLTASFENGCAYCMAAHSTLAAGQGVPSAVITALRVGEPLPDGRLEALRSFTRQVVTRRGWVADEQVQAFLAAGFDRRAVLEVILGVSLKVLSNYTNHLAHTPLDAAFQAQEWAPAASR